jgi:hypothetical protein
VYDLSPAEEPPPPCLLCGQHHVSVIREVVIRDRVELEVFRKLGYEVP